VQSRFSPVRTFARRILQKHAGPINNPAGLTQFPLNLAAICNSCGIGYEEVDYFPESIEALILPTHKQPVAVINKNSSAPQWRFSLAHQLCHFLLHHYPAVLEGTVTPGSALDIESEGAADAFAVELLVPSPALNTYFNTGQSSAADVARKFLVPDSVAKLAINNFLARISLSPVRK
jgi:Zn-dependent peptidase ImmA (M78 family)